MGRSESSDRRGMVEGFVGVIIPVVTADGEVSAIG